MMKKINYWFLIVLIVYIPFYRFFQALLESHASLSTSAVFWIAHWYEPVILLLLLCNFVVYLFVYKKTLSKSQIISLIILLFSLVSIFFLFKTVGRGLEGFRFLILPLAVYLTVSLSNIKNFNSLIKGYLWISIFVAIWSIIERFLPVDYWVKWQILNSQTYWYGYHTVVGVKQGVSFLGGPNILGAYLLLAFFFSIFKLKKPILSSLYFWLSLLIFLAILLTFSRSAFVGLIITLFMVIFVAFKDWKKRLIMVFAIILLAVIMFFVYLNGGRSIQNLFTHGGSQLSHSTALQASVSEIKNRLQEPKLLLFGGGLGSAGPVAVKYGDGIVSESWYLEVILELGIIGLILWLSFFYFTLKKIWQRGEKWLFWGAISILIATAFLHTLSDNPAISFTLFAILALLCTSKIDQQRNSQ